MALLYLPVGEEFNYKRQKIINKMGKWKKDRSKPYCSHCKKTTVSLFVYNIAKNGKKYYMCRRCNTKRVKEYRATPNGRNKIFGAVYRSIEKLSYKQEARIYLNSCLRKGLIKKPKKCSICGLNKKIEGHHTDYSKPLDVVWVCRSCHSDLEKV